jgi:hypothetical protein
MVGQAGSLNVRGVSEVDLRDLRSSLHCLANDPFQMLGARNDKAISLIVSHDDRSYAHERHLWIFVKRGMGIYDVFDEEIVLTPPKRYVMQNNATIRWDGRTVDEPGALLGGIWTHDVMERNFRKALRSKVTVMRPFDPLRRDANCESYASPKGFH